MNKGLGMIRQTAILPFKYKFCIVVNLSHWYVVFENVTPEHETLEFGRLISQHYLGEKKKKNRFLSMSALTL